MGSKMGRASVNPSEDIGRQIFMRRLKARIQAHQAARIAPPSAAFGPICSNEISVDRFDFSSIREMTAIGDANNAQNRNADPGQANTRFRGWLRFPAAMPICIGWRIVESAIEGAVPNKYHADMLLPEFDEDESKSAEAQWYDCISELCVSLIGKFKWQDRFGDAPVE